MTRAPLLLIPLIALSACSTPRERCISSANRPLGTLDSLIRTTRGNVDRGFAYVSVQDVRVIQTFCEGTNDDGSTFTFPCEETETFNRREPVSINIEEERIKLAQLETRRNQAAGDAAEMAQQCVALYPE